MPVSSTSGTGGSSTSSASGAKWSPNAGSLQVALTATTQDTAVALSLPVSSGQVVRYHYEYYSLAANNNMPLYFTGVTVSSFSAWTNTLVSGATQTASTQQSNPVSGTQYSLVSASGSTILDVDVVVSSAGTVTLWLGIVNPNNTFTMYRRASIQIIG